MPPRRQREQSSRSPMYVLYPSIGPAPAAATQMFGLKRAEKMVADWRAWRSRYGAAWDAAEDVPPPPHREEFGFP